MFKITAPLRIDMAGGMTDLPVISGEVGTSIVNLAIDVYSDPQKSKPLQLILSVNPNSQNSQTNNLIKTFISFHPEMANYDFQVADPLPTGTGLGGSSRLSVCLTVTLNKNSLDRGQIVCDAHNFEVNEMGIEGGFQDFISAAFGGLNYINFNYPDITNLSNNPNLGMKFDPELKNYLNNHMVILLLKTNQTSSALVAKDQIKRYKANLYGIRPILLAIKKCNQKMFELLTSSGQLAEIGQIMTESTRLQRELSPLVCGNILSDWQKRAEPFIYGVRTPGAGANSLFLLVKPNMLEPLLSEFSSKDVKILFASVNEKGVVVCG